MDDIIGSGSRRPQAGSGAGAAAAADLIKDGSTATFVADVIEASRQVPVIVDFWATWCGPCKQLTPALEKAVTEAHGAVKLVKIDVDRNKELAAQLRIQTVPMVYAFKDGRPADGFAGAIPESQIKAFIQRLTAGRSAPSIEEMITEAKTILAEGDAQTAAEIFQEILTQEPSNGAAYGGLCRALLALGEADTVRQLIDEAPAEVVRHPDVAAIKTALELADSAGQVGPASDLRRRLANDAADHEARFDLAMSYWAGGEQEAAMDELLELFKRDRAWNDDAARKQLVKLFEALGPTHPLTVAGRRRLSALLFS